MVPQKVKIIPISVVLFHVYNWELCLNFQVAEANASESSKNKRCKPNEGKANGNGAVKAEDEGDDKQAKANNAKPPEPPKDYIHVRARRGQATDSHSLAERVRITKCQFSLNTTFN